eukprot:TRINITY_DN1785_c0_g1_i4.p1 TRINITY_DN1785_c0_g1~~TRINITY_DN1785_c0_g1_i4.p1  ORF type:complete len:261 (+),score=55.56 TRINITY_DN1785_c0_g1_i4:849-1631(+)
MVLFTKLTLQKIQSAFNALALLVTTVITQILIVILQVLVLLFFSAGVEVSVALWHTTAGCLFILSFITSTFYLITLLDTDNDYYCSWFRFPGWCSKVLCSKESKPNMLLLCLCSSLFFLSAHIFEIVNYAFFHFRAGSAGSFFLVFAFVLLFTLGCFACEAWMLVILYNAVLKSGVRVMPYVVGVVSTVVTLGACVLLNAVNISSLYYNDDGTPVAEWLPAFQQGAFAATLAAYPAIFLHGLSSHSSISSCSLVEQSPLR